MGGWNWRRVRRALMALALLAPLLGPLGDAAAADGDVPFPLTGRITVRPTGKRFVIDGKQVIPAGSAIRVESGVRVVGVNGASLEVKGSLQVHGVGGSLVEFKSVDFSPTVAPEGEVHFDVCTLDGCSFVHTESVSFSGGFVMENTKFIGQFTFRVQTGYVRLMNMNYTGDISVGCVPSKGRVPEVAVRSCSLGSVTLTGDCAGTIRDSTFTGSITAVDFTDLLIDGCDVKGGIILEQSAEGSFSKLRMQNCNLLGGANVTFKRPTGPKTTIEKVRLSKFHFGSADGKAALTDKEIADRIDDGADDPNVSVKAFVQNPKERPH